MKIFFYSTVHNISNDRRTCSTTHSTYMDKVVVRVFVSEDQEEGKSLHCLCSTAYTRYYVVYHLCCRHDCIRTRCRGANGTL